MVHLTSNKGSKIRTFAFAGLAVAFGGMVGVSIYQNAEYDQRREKQTQSISYRLDRAAILNSMNPDPASRACVDSMIRTSWGLVQSSQKADAHPSAGSSFWSTRLRNEADSLADRSIQIAGFKLDSAVRADLAASKAQFADTTALFKRQLRVQSGKVQNKPQGQMPITPRSFL